MLTPRDIQEVGFTKAVFGGYDMESVDEFLETVTADYAKLYKDNAILKSKIKVLVDKIEDYRKTEDSMRMTLLTAQRTSEDLLNRAKTKSTDIVAGAEAEADAKLAEIERKIYLENERLKRVQQETFDYISKSKKLIKVFGAFLEKIEDTDIYQDAKKSASATSKPSPTMYGSAFGTAFKNVKAQATPQKSPEPAPVQPVAPVQPAPEPAPAETVSEDEDVQVYKPAKSAEKVDTSESETAEAETVSSETEVKPAEEKTEEKPKAENDDGIPDSLFENIEEAVQEQVKAENAADSKTPSEEDESQSDKDASESQDEEQPAEEKKDEEELYAETMKLFYEEEDKKEKEETVDEDDFFSPRPKFKFDNLQFGSNYDNKNK